MPAASTFKQRVPLEKRMEESARIFDRYPDRIPVICERAASNTTVPEMDKAKFLVPRDLTVQHFQYVVRKRIELEADQAIFMFINGSIAPNSEPIARVYSQHSDEDGFLYITYSGESTLGA